ncbi:hypothetical protein [Nonomuraea diastatica]|uniref:hypothetical protein n=1 Tax=Nonomuraea diastatica TaxID=1848329 RepID=UPI00140E59C7|nr:hypothetical protein [Nonomuraea diastatica]
MLPARSRAGFTSSGVLGAEDSSPLAAGTLLPWCAGGGRCSNYAATSRCDESL